MICGLLTTDTLEGTLTKKVAECVECGEEYNIRRLALGYQTCLDCGDRSAQRAIIARTRASLQAMTPNHYAGDVTKMLDDPNEG